MRIGISVILVLLLCSIQPFQMLENEYLVSGSIEGNNFQYSLSTLESWPSTNHDDPCPNPWMQRIHGLSVQM